jgi:GTP pyrophosphokinase
MMFSERFADSMTFAAKLHANQKRKGTDIPYIAHLLGVASLALEHGANEEEAIAALLHDAIEDQGGAATREEIRRRFGDTVTEIVDGCTDADTTPKPPWRQRKQAYIAHIPTASASVRLVSSADKLHNARSLLNDYRLVGDSLWNRFKGGKEGTLWYYRALVEAFRKAGSTPLVDELDRVVSELEHLVESTASDLSEEDPPQRPKRERERAL